MKTIIIRQRGFTILCASLILLAAAQYLAGGASGIARAQEAAPANTSDDGKSPAAVFEAKLSAWKDLIKDLRALTLEYQKAEPAAAPELSGRWYSMIAKGEEMLPGLRDAGVKAFLAAPNEDRQLVRFLEKLLVDAGSRDQYDASILLSKAFIENNVGFNLAYLYGGQAAFALDEYDLAETWLKEAAALGVAIEATEENAPLSPQPLLIQVTEYRGFWEREEEIRAKEAEADDLPRVLMKTTEGEMVLELYENEAPEAVGNFVSLVEKKFYDGLTFHRVLPGFMAQGGCPDGNGQGGPGYQIYCECHKENYRKHFRGTISMAHAGPDTGGSQFFLTFLPAPQLNGLHTAFGRVIKGLDTLDKIKRINPKDPSASDPSKIISVEVLRKRDHNYVPNKVK